MDVPRVLSVHLSDDMVDEVPHHVNGEPSKSVDMPTPEEHTIGILKEPSVFPTWESASTPTTSRWRVPFSLTLAFGAGLAICLVGFLAWAVPFTNLTATIDPLALSIRTLLLSKVANGLQLQWGQIRQQAIAQRKLWNTFGQPGTPVANAVQLGRLFQPMMESNPTYTSIVYNMIVGPCVEIATLVRDSSLNLKMTLQNCTRRWQVGWDPVAQNFTGKVLGYLPYSNPATANLLAPMNLTTPSDPFIWLKVYNPNAGTGNVFAAAVGLFNGTTGAFIGRYAISITTNNLRQVLLDQIAAQPQLANGKMALFDPNTGVVASTHGLVALSTMYNLSSIGDPDLEAAADVLSGLPGGWCANRSLVVEFSQTYFLDTTLIADSYPAIYQLQWCLLLLTPRSNTLAAVDRSLTFAVVFVCAMTCSVTVVAVIIGFLVTRPLQRLTLGMCALKSSDVHSARKYAQDRSRFAELHRAQRSYQSLVDAMEAFEKYVPKAVVQGLLAGTILPKLGMAERNLAVGFMDVEGFTDLCESTAVTAMVNTTSQLFDMCCDYIAQSQGTIDKFIGDCIMAFWGAPVALPQPALHAAEAVLGILTRLQQSPILLPATEKALQLRVGLHYGKCLAGNFGASGRWDYTVMGDVVNVASRLEALNKQFRTRCLISGAIREQTAATKHLASRTRMMGGVVLLGKKVPVMVYELDVEPFADASGWAEAALAYQRGCLRQAAAYFGALDGDAAAQELTRDVLATPAGGPYVRLMRTK